MNVVNAAECSRGDHGFIWVLVGQGQDLPALKLAAGERAPNLSVLPLQLAEAMPQMYAAVDVLLLNQIAGRYAIVRKATLIGPRRTMCGERDLGHY
jgi:hypothetical protein